MNAQPLLRAEGLVPAELAYAPPLDLTLDRGLVVMMGPERARLGHWLRALAGVNPPAAGALHLLGRPLQRHDWRQLRRSVGYVTPEAPLLSILSGLRNVMLPALYHRMAPEQELERRAKTLLSEIAYDADHGVLPAYMGELQRHHLLIARALMLEPRMLLLEQPLAGLDTDAGDVLRDYIVAVVQPRVALLLVAANDAPLAQQADAVLFASAQSVRLFDSWAALLACEADDVQYFIQQERRACAALQ
jgi:ABC-type lipoprotein export system ATPase subunit